MVEALKTEAIPPVETNIDDRLAVLEQKLKEDQSKEPDKYGIASLFTDTDYKEVVYEYEGLESCGGQLRLKALKGASTDFDLTGQIVW